MGWRHSELSGIGPEVVQLDRQDAAATYHQAVTLCSRTRHGLNETRFSAVERLKVEGSEAAARAWLAERIGSGELLLVFGLEDVVRVPSTLFLDHWQDMFCPSRDDVVIVPVVGEWALFYCHEDEFEFAR